MRDTSYRQFLYNWIKKRNEMWLGNTVSLQSFATSDKVVAQTLLIQERQKEMNERRELTPLKRESHIIRFQENECDGSIQASLHLLTRGSYGIKSQLIEEMIEETFTVILQPGKSGWKIACYDLKTPVLSTGVNDIVTIQPTPLDLSNKSEKYNRKEAVMYAEKYWNSYNSAYKFFTGNDCTNYLSQSIHAGGIPMTTSSSRSKGWWYKRGSWSFSWTVAHSFYWYLRGKRSKGLRAELVPTSKALQIGDVICYDWKGDGRWNHNTIVTKIDPNGEPLVNAHSTNSRHRYWAYKDSHEYTENTKYAFFHILDP